MASEFLFDDLIEITMRQRLSLVIERFMQGHAVQLPLVENPVGWGGQKFIGEGENRIPAG